MNKKLQVFVSSTYTDLIEERQAAVEAILDAGHIPAGMELFKAGKSQMKTICKWIDESDVYMLILGGRYGSIEEESGLSYTELEYRYALSKNMPVFAIVLDDSFLSSKVTSLGMDAVFETINIDNYDIFKKAVKSNIVKFVNNTDQIISVIHSHLHEILSDSEYHLVGWVRNDIMNEQCNLLLKTIDKLKQSKKRLKKQLKKIQKESGNNFGNYTFLETYKNLKNAFFTIRHKQYNALDCFINCYNKPQELANEIFAYLYSYNLVENEFYSSNLAYDKSSTLISRMIALKESKISNIPLNSKNRISKSGDLFYSMLIEYEFINF